MAKETNSLSILYIDDDEDDYIILKHYLAGFADKTVLHWFDNYIDGKNQIGTDSYDVCIIDYRLGQYSGIDLISEFRAHGSKVPILFLTGDDDPALQKEAKQKGANDILDKGEVNTDSLQSAINTCLGNK
jgi:two-component system, cell cycle sensor histidine kinase and response regulator CckA